MTTPVRAGRSPAVGVLGGPRGGGAAGRAHELEHVRAVGQGRVPGASVPPVLLRPRPGGGHGACSEEGAVRAAARAGPATPGRGGCSSGSRDDRPNRRRSGRSCAAPRRRRAVPRLAAPPPENPTQRIPASTSVALGACAATAFVSPEPLAATQTLDSTIADRAPGRERPADLVPGVAVGGGGPAGDREEVAARRRGDPRRRRVGRGSHVQAGGRDAEEAAGLEPGRGVVDAADVPGGQVALAVAGADPERVAVVVGAEVDAARGLRAGQPVGPGSPVRRDLDVVARRRRSSRPRPPSARRSPRRAGRPGRRRSPRPARSCP